MKATQTHTAPETEHSPSQIFPLWVGSLVAHRVTSGKWRVDIASNTFGLVNNPKTKRFYFPGEMLEDHALNMAANSAPSVRLHSYGCWIVAKAKEKYGDQEARHELFGAYMAHLRAKYDGLKSPVFECEDAQREVMAALKLPGMMAANFEPLKIHETPL